MRDENEAALQKGLARIGDSLQKRVSQGKLTPEQCEKTLALVSTTADWSALAEADVAIESVFEDVEAKRAVIARLEEVCKPDAIIATNTSTISLDALAAGMTHPERLVGMHFFNPAHRMPLVEVIHREETDDAVVAAIVQLAKRLRKTPVLVRNREGFLVNRLFVPYLKEAFWLLEEGIEPEAIDRAMTDFGFRDGAAATDRHGGARYSGLLRPRARRRFSPPRPAAGGRRPAGRAGSARPEERGGSLQLRPGRLHSKV